MADPTPVPAPVPQPAPVPAPAPVAVQLPPYLIALIVGTPVMLVATILAFGLFLFHQDHPAPPVKPYDEAFVAVGRSYAEHLAPTYSTSWGEGADLLDSGQPYSVALKHIGNSWTSGRQQFFDQIVTPELDKIVAESTKDADVTAAQRVKASAAFRGLSKGLAGK